MFVMMPCDGVATNNGVKLAFGGATNGGCGYICVFRRVVFDKEFSTESDDNPTSADFIAQEIAIMFI